MEFFLRQSDAAQKSAPACLKKKGGKAPPFIISVQNRERGGQTRPSPAISLVLENGHRPHRADRHVKHDVDQTVHHIAERDRPVDCDRVRQPEILPVRQDGIAELEEGVQQLRVGLALEQVARDQPEEKYGRAE